MKIILTILLSCLLCGCGYHVTGQSASLPGQTLHVYLPYIVNQTTEPYIETELVSRISQELARCRNYSEVGNGDQADAQLSVVISKYVRQAVSYDSSDDIAEYRIEMTINATLTNVADGAVLWSQSIGWRATYVTSADKMVQRDRERGAVAEVCQRLAAEILFQMQKRRSAAP